MGGIGSGRHWHYGAKATTSNYHGLDVRTLARDGWLKPGMRFGWQWTIDGEKVGSINLRTEENQIWLHYRTRADGADWEPMEYSVRLLSQQLHYGGHRQWFACPARGCGRRVAILYGGRVFACRHCHRLAYQSQREQNYQRYQRRAMKIKARLGWDRSPCGDWGLRPKGMHRKTFVRLLAELDHWDSASDAAFGQYFIARFGHLDGLLQDQ